MPSKPPPQDERPGLYTTDEIAAMWDVSRQAVQKQMVRRGWTHTVARKSIKYYDQKAVDMMTAERQKNPYYKGRYYPEREKA